MSFSTILQLQTTYFHCKNLLQITIFLLVDVNGTKLPMFPIEQYHIARSTLFG
jgi:hypothetical protein